MLDVQPPWVLFAKLGDVPSSQRRDCDVSMTEHDPKLRNVYCPAGHGVTRSLKGIGCQVVLSKGVGSVQCFNRVE